MSKIDQLIAVQEIDKEIYDHSLRLADIPKEIQALKQAVQDHKGELQEADKEYKSYQVQQKDKENELGSKEEHINKLQAQLNIVKTNKEYAALQSEINNLKADNSMLEEQILKFFEEGDKYKKKITEAKNKIAEAEKEAAEKEKQLLEEKKGIEAKVEELKTKKKEAAKGVDAETLALYEKILAKKEGVALVPVQGNGCGACGMQLRAQLVDELHMADKIVVCESCSRILYLEKKE